MILNIIVCFNFPHQYTRMLQNFVAEQPHQHAVYFTSVIISEQAWTKDELADAMEGKLLLGVQIKEIWISRRSFI